MIIRMLKSKKAGSSQGGSTSDYASLTNKPQINGVTLQGNKTASDLSLASASDVAAQSALWAGLINYGNNVYYESASLSLSAVSPITNISTNNASVRRYGRICILSLNASFRVSASGWARACLTAPQWAIPAYSVYQMYVDQSGNPYFVGTTAGSQNIDFYFTNAHASTNIFHRFSLAYVGNELP